MSNCCQFLQHLPNLTTSLLPAGNAPGDFQGEDSLARIPRKCLNFSASAPPSGQGRLVAGASFYAYSFGSPSEGIIANLDETRMRAEHLELTTSAVSISAPSSAVGTNIDSSTSFEPDAKYNDAPYRPRSILSASAIGEAAGASHVQRTNHETFCTHVFLCKCHQSNNWCDRCRTDAANLFAGLRPTR